MIKITITKDSTSVECPPSVLHNAKTSKRLVALVDELRNQLQGGVPLSDDVVAFLDGEETKASVTPTHRFRVGEINRDTEWFSAVQGEPVVLTSSAGDGTFSGYVHALPELVFEGVKVERFEPLTREENTD